MNEFRELKDTNNNSGVIKQTFSKRKATLIAFLSFVVVIFCTVLFVIFSSLSSNKTNLEGYVLSSESNLAISDALVSIGKLSTKTDSQGFFEFKNLYTGKVDVSVSALNFEDYTNTYTLNNGILGPSTSNITIYLTPAKTAAISGKLVGEDVSFSEASVSVDNLSSLIDSNGNFSINSSLGNKLISFHGNGFKDISINIDVVVGENNVGEVRVERASDITAKVRDSITHLKLNQAKVQVTNVAASSISLDNEANLLLSDLAADFEYTIQVDLEGYKTYFKTIKTKVGKNDLFNIDLVPEGKAYFFMGVDKNIQAYKSDFDGENLEQLTNIDKLNPIFEQVINKSFYFSSDHERASNSIESRAYLPYSLDVTTGDVTRITGDTENLGYILPNFRSDIALNLTEDPENRKVWVLQTMKLNSSSKKEVTRVDTNTHTISDMSISSKADILAYVVSSLEADELYSYDIASSTTRSIIKKDQINLLAISDDSTIILFLDGQSTLYAANLISKEVRVVQREFFGENVFFKLNSNSEIYYSQFGEPDSFVYTSSIKSFDPQKVLTVEDADIFRLYYQGDFIYYITQKGLYVVDPNFWIPANLVIEGTISYEGKFRYDIEDK